MGKRREGERERRGDRWREGGEDEAGREESWTDRVMGRRFEDEQDSRTAAVSFEDWR